MAKFGYTLSSEERSTPELVENARQAEAAGFDFVGISDHFHPWTETQGQSAFVWTTLGAISQVTKNLEVFVEVTCPIMRIHPAILAQAAATAATLLEDRLIWGLGSGENLNEHVVGQGWPHIDVRQEMLEEAVEIIRQLWRGDYVSFYGRFFTVEEAKIYTMPETLPPLVISGLGPQAIKLAARIGDGLVSLAPEPELIKIFEQHGGMGKPKYTQIHVCYDKNEQQAKDTAAKVWSNTGVSGQLISELRLPAYFEQAAGPLTPEQITEKIVLGPETGKYIELADQYLDAGYDHVYFHQIGPKQAEFMEFYQRELAPALESRMDKVYTSPVDITAVNELMSGFEFPVTREELTRAAEAKAAPKELAGFFESLPAGQKFESAEELIRYSRRKTN